MRARAVGARAPALIQASELVNQADRDRRTVEVPVTVVDVVVLRKTFTPFEVRKDAVDGFG